MAKNAILKDLFEDEVFEKILKWAESSMNYPDKADKIDKLMKKCGLKPLDSGTNRICYIHKKYPKVVFKIGFDTQGILDNLNEFHKASLDPVFASCYDLDEEGIILVEENCPTIDIDLFNKEKTQKKVRKILNHLDEEGFVLVDLGLDKHKNYGIDSKGEIRIIDFGYVELKSIANFNCPHVRYINEHQKKACKGRLKYNKNFTMLVCDKCDNQFRIDTVLEGYTDTKYESQEKTPKYKVSDELDEFYKQYRKTSKHRDRETLKQFVSISNKIDTGVVTTIKEEPETSVSALHKLKRLNLLTESGRQQIQEQKNLNVPAPTHHQMVDRRNTSLPASDSQKPKPSIPVYESTDRGIDVLKHNEEIEKEKMVQRLNDSFEIINNDQSEISDRLIRDLFFIRFPEVAKVLDEMKNRALSEDDSIVTVSSEESATDFETLRLLKESKIEVYESTNNSDELHFGMQVENLEKEPVIVISVDDRILHINLAEHMKMIKNLDTEGETELIAAEIIVAPLSEFDNDYESAYFGNSDEDDTQD